MPLVDELEWQVNLIVVLMGLDDMEKHFRNLLS